MSSAENDPMAVLPGAGAVEARCRQPGTEATDATDVRCLYPAAFCGTLVAVPSVKALSPVEQPPHANPGGLSARDDLALQRAVDILESKSFVARLTEITGEPVRQLLKRLPGPVSRQVHAAVRRTLSQALDVALYKMNSGLPEPPAALFQAVSGFTGGVSGFFGIGALALELPVTTTLMLRSIAGIAVRHGEQLSQPASRLACLEVFALGPQKKHGVSGETSYYATRAFLARAVSQAAQALLERQTAGGSAPVIVDLVTSIGSRFGVVVSEKFAAGSIPVVGAIGGAAVNLAFMQHFQQLARAHFVIRQLERSYGSELVRGRYEWHDENRKARI